MAGDLEWGKASEVDISDRLELELRDGTEVIARPLIAEDRAELAEAYRRVSSEARYNRFWTHTGEVIGEKLLDRVLSQDQSRHISWAVLDLSREFSPMGAASWWRDGSRSSEAEISLIVMDGDQGRGVGTLLLALMWLTALRAGLDSLVGYVQSENRHAADWMRDCSASAKWDGYKLVFRWDLKNQDRLPQTPAAAELAIWLARLAPKISR